MPDSSNTSADNASPGVRAPVDPVWVDTPAALEAALATRPARVGLDTEFIRERTYWPKLALVQIALEAEGATRILLVDALVPGMDAALAALLHDRAVLKVMHSPSEDLVAFSHHCGALPDPLFDTQAAAALAGMDAGMGYQRLVEQVTGVLLPKGETRSDWMRRPLSPAQLGYAADDVRHLFALHDELETRLRELGRLDWLADDAARTLERAAGTDAERWPHLSLRAAQFLEPAAQQRLLRLLRWREARARETDRPRTWILDNELANALARQPPRDEAELQSRLDAHPKAPRKLAGVVWRVLNEPLSDEAELPDASRLERLDKQRLKALKTAVAARAAELGVPEGVLASRKHLEALLLDPGHWPAALEGWRREQLEPVLAPILAGSGTGG
ncbi:ribonuclease D [Novilysobacter defluvii]|nr:ribonuclease D [Lysobacter defluvii]